jgi:hypothetical protein
MLLLVALLPAGGPFDQSAPQQGWTHPHKVTDIFERKKIIRISTPDPLLGLTEKSATPNRLCEAKLLKGVKGFAQHSEQECSFGLRRISCFVDLIESLLYRIIGLGKSRQATVQGWSSFVRDVFRDFLMSERRNSRAKKNHAQR